MAGEEVVSISRSKAIADYWANLFEVEDKREELHAALFRLIEDGGQDPEVSVDYDPRGLLLDAVREIGIECRGCMFSAQGLFPEKHRMIIRTGFVVVNEGYGGERRTIWGDDVPSSF